MAKAPSPIAIAVIALVGFIGPKKIRNPIANFSMAAATKTGSRIAGADFVKVHGVFSGGLIAKPSTRFA